MPKKSVKSLNQTVTSERTNKTKTFDVSQITDRLYSNHMHVARMEKLTESSLKRERKIPRRVLCLIKQRLEQEQKDKQLQATN